MIINNQYYKLNIFEEPKGMIILETELTNASKKLEIPDFLTVKKEITDDEYQKIANEMYDDLTKCLDPEIMYQEKIVYPYPEHELEENKEEVTDENPTEMYEFEEKKSIISRGEIL